MLSVAVKRKFNIQLAQSLKIVNWLMILEWNNVSFEVKRQEIQKFTYIRIMDDLWLTFGQFPNDDQLAYEM